MSVIATAGGHIGRVILRGDRRARESQRQCRVGLIGSNGAALQGGGDPAATSQRRGEDRGAPERQGDHGKPSPGRVHRQRPPPQPPDPAVGSSGEVARRAQSSRYATRSASPRPPVKGTGSPDSDPPAPTSDGELRLVDGNDAGASNSTTAPDQVGHRPIGARRGHPVPPRSPTAPRASSENAYSVGSRDPDCIQQAHQGAQATVSSARAAARRPSVARSWGRCHLGRSGGQVRVRVGIDEDAEAPPPWPPSAARADLAARTRGTERRRFAGGHDVGHLVVDRLGQTAMSDQGVPLRGVPQSSSPSHSSSSSRVGQQAVRDASRTPRRERAASHLGIHLAQTGSYVVTGGGMVQDCGSPSRCGPRPRVRRRRGGAEPSMLVTLAPRQP